MNTRKSSFRRLAAGVGALSLALVGFAGGTAAMADAGGNAEPGNIDNTLTGSLTIHKHVADEDSTDNNPAGAPLEDVVFQLQKITNIDLTSADDWATIEAAYAAQPGTAPNLSGLTPGTAIPVTATNALGIATATNLAVGAYYVTEVGSGNNLITAPAIPFIITIPQPNEDGSWNYNPVAYPKNDIGEITPTKSVGDPESNVGLGQTVDWTITVPLPAITNGYDEFEIQDSLVSGLTFDSWKSVTVGATTLATPADYMIDPTSHNVTFTQAGLDQLNDEFGESGSVSVTAVLSTTVTEVGAHPNQATIVVNGNNIPTNEPQTNWGALEITKVDSANVQDLLPGATFEVYMADSSGDPTGPVIASDTTGADGKVHFDFYIGAGAMTTMDVVIKETAAPQGYVLPADPFSGPYTLTASTTVALSTTVDTVENYAPTAPNLPLTGSTGTLLFMIVGLALVGTGGGLMALRRTRSKVE